MDPNDNLVEQLRLARRMAADCDDDSATRLAELVLALDEWLRSGGFYPERWDNAGRKLK